MQPDIVTEPPFCTGPTTLAPTLPGLVVSAKPGAGPTTVMFWLDSRTTPYWSLVIRRMW